MYSTYSTEDNFYIPLIILQKSSSVFGHLIWKENTEKNYHLVLDSDIVPNSRNNYLNNARKNNINTRNNVVQGLEGYIYFWDQGFEQNTVRMGKCKIP